MPLLQALSWLCRLKGIVTNRYAGCPAWTGCELAGKIRQAYEDQKRAIGGRGQRLSDIVKCWRLLLPKTLHSYVVTL